MVCAGAAEAGLIHGLAKLRRGAIVVTGSLNFRVTCRLDLAQGAVKVLGQQLTHGVKLQPDWQLQSHRDP
jgi:hypothetical protein